MSGTVIVYGGKGGLGQVVVKHFQSLSYKVVSVDIGASEAADLSVVVSLSQDWVEQEASVVGEVGRLLGSSKVKAVINVAGGWAGGNTTNPDWVKNADLMWKQSVWSSAIAATLASKFLCEGGLLVLPGAEPAVGGTPGMMGYGMAKAAVHQLVKSLGSPSSGLPPSSCALAMLPVTLDTPMNRKFMPDADKSTWTPLEELSKFLSDWTAGTGRFPSGSLVSIITENNQTSLKLHS